MNSIDILITYTRKFYTSYMYYFFEVSLLSMIFLSGMNKIARL